MEPPLVERNFSSVDILLTFTLCQCVMTLLNSLSGTEARSLFQEINLGYVIGKYPHPYFNMGCDSNLSSTTV